MSWNVNTRRPNEQSSLNALPWAENFTSKDFSVDFSNDSNAFVQYALQVGELKLKK